MESAENSLCSVGGLVCGQCDLCSDGTTTYILSLDTPDPFKALIPESDQQSRRIITLHAVLAGKA